MSIHFYLRSEEQSLSVFLRALYKVPLWIWGVQGNASLDSRSSYKTYLMNQYMQSSDLITFDKDLQRIALLTVQTVFDSKMNTLL